MDNSFKVNRNNFLKFFLIVIVFFLSFLAIIAKLFVIQIIDREIYHEKARIQHEANRPLKAKRGNLIDRNGNLLVVSNELYTVAVDPLYLSDTTMLYTLLSFQTKQDPEIYRQKVRLCTTRYIELERNLKESQIGALKVLNEKGVIITSRPYRYSIFGNVAAQIIGLTDIDDYGISGLEQRYDDELQGQDGTMVCMRDGKGRLYLSPSLPIIEAKDGNTLQLTIDINLQKIVEYELAQGVIAAQARSGTAVVVDPSTGDILAMSSYPSYDPRNRKTASGENIRNKAITDTYEPGSTFKLITAAAALEEGVIEENDTIRIYGGAYRLFDRIIRDDHGGRDLTFREAIEQSSNVAFAQVARKIPSAGGYSLFPKYIRDFGFGLETGIDLYGEVSGFLPKAKKFSEITKAYIGHGYGISVTPLQLTMAFAVIANGGNLMKPRVVRKIFSPDGELLKDNTPELIRQVISKETARRLCNLFQGVVDNGTGTNAKIDGLPIAGKTGTSRQYAEDGYLGNFYNASFVGIFPAQNPKAVILVLVDRPSNGYYGGSVAAPIFRDITTRWSSINTDFAQRDYIIDSVFKGTNLESSNNIFAPSFIGLNTKYANKLAGKKDIELVYTAEGIIKRQNPNFKQFVPRNRKVSVWTYAKDVNFELADRNRDLPNVQNLPLRRALAVLHSAGFRVQVNGSGTVTSQIWKTDAYKKPYAVLECY